VCNATDVDRGGIARCLNDFDIVEEEVHLHGWHVRRHGEGGTGAPGLPPSAR
jgi:hypothetical protein